jgi:hypothetical protein
VFDSGAQAMDLRDGDVTANIVSTGEVNVNEVGTYTITYTVSDSSNNESTATRTVNVVDKTPPEITILGNNPVEIYKGGNYNDPGAIATDNNDSNLNIIVSGDTVDTSTIDQYTIRYTVSDSAGNTTTKVRIVNVIPEPDTIPPVITIFGNNPEEVDQGKEYIDSGAQAIDLRDGDVTNNIVTTGEVDINKEGTYTITYTVPDSSNNESTATRTVIVIV